VLIQWQHFCDQDVTQVKDLLGIVQGDISDHETETTISLTMQAKPQQQTGGDQSKLFDQGT
jgi:hypothetical protein